MRALIGTLVAVAAALFSSCTGSVRAQDAGGLVWVPTVEVVDARLAAQARLRRAKAALRKRIAPRPG